jgi:hypothetical protein
MTYGLVEVPSPEVMLAVDTREIAGRRPLAYPIEAP